MNREIRFRGLTINTKRWVYGYLAEIETNWDYYNGYGLPTEYSKVIISTEYTTREAVDIIPETVGQYTGLKDKNEKDIYEGDILKDCDTREIKTVIWHKNCFILRDTKGFYQWTYFEDEHEVIGNIYENPDLLEVANG